jgi:hypothetical protein
MGDRPNASRNLLTFVLAAAGCVLLGLSLMDWTSYSAFTFSLLWR